MNFKIDENLPMEVRDLLTRSGHNVVSVLDQQLGGAPDAAIASACQDENRALITLDLGFSDIRAYPPEDYPGLVVLRLRRQDTPHVLDIFSKLLTVVSTETMVGRLWIVEEDRVRVHGESSDPP